MSGDVKKKVYSTKLSGIEDEKENSQAQSVSSDRMQ